MSEVETTTNSSTEKGFFGKLANGDFGLAKTYWLYGMLVRGVFTVISYEVTSTGGLAILTLAYIAYDIPVIMGIWRAANKYQGEKIWAVLAKISVVLGVFMLVVGLLAVIGLLLAPTGN